MSQDPEAVLHAGFDALADADAAALLRLLMPQAMEHVHDHAIRVLKNAERNGQDPELISEVRRAVLSRFGVQSVEEVRDLSAIELVRRLLARLPRRRKGIRCETLGHVLEGADRAHVLFRVRFPSDIVDPPIMVASLQRADGRWRLPPPLTDWIVPGLENTLFGDSWEE